MNRHDVDLQTFFQGPVYFSEGRFRPTELPLEQNPAVRFFNGRGEHRCRAEVSRRARPGVVHGMGIWWRKFGVDGTNVNQLTSQRLTDIGRGPTFYDCLVQVAALDA